MERRPRIWLAAIGACIALTGSGCGQAAHARAAHPVAAPPDGAAPNVTERLARMAYAQARAAGNPYPRSAAYVGSRRAAAVRITESGERVDSNQPVFVVEVVGPFPHYRRFSVPPGVEPSMPCRALTFVVERTTWQTLDAGCGPDRGLTELGAPHALAPPPGGAAGPTYVVDAPVLRFARGERPWACFSVLLSLPPAGCGGVPVSGYEVRRMSGRLLHMVGTWDGQVLRLIRAPVPATSPRRDPAPPTACRGRPTPAADALARMITRDHAGLHMLELTPCGRTVWVLVAAADRATISYVREHFGRDVVVRGWLRPAHG